MKKFNFRLQKVLEYKEHLEKKAQQELAIIQVKLEQEKQLLQNLCDEQILYQNQRAEITKKGAKPKEILDIEKYLQCLKKRIQRQNQVIHQQRMQFIQKQNQLRELVQDKKSLEKYKEKKKTAYEKVVSTAEQNFLDELAIRKHVTRLEESRKQ